MKSNDHSNSLKEPIRKLFVSSLSVPTFLVQLMGYFPFSFHKANNSIRVKFLSFPMLSLIFHITFTVSCIAFYIIHVDDFGNLAGANSTKGTSATLFYTYLGSIFLATGSAFGIRMKCVLKHKEITSFYSNLKSTVSKVLIASTIDTEDLEEWKKEMNKEMTPVRITTFVGLLFVAFASIAITYSFHFGDKNFSFAWKWFGSLAVIFCSLLTVLYSALLIWLSVVVSFITLGFKALGHSHGLAGNKISLSKLSFWNWRLLSKDYTDFEISSNGKKIEIQDSQEYFLNMFLEIKELVKTLNSVFAIPMILTLAGVVCYGVIYGFFLLQVWSNARELPAYAFYMNTTVMTCMISLCFAHFWSFCNSSHKLQEQTNNCLLQLLKIDWDSYTSGSQHKIQMFYQYHLLHPTLISPGHYFYLTRRTLTSVAAVLITYIIVLLQFKSSE